MSKKISAQNVADDLLFNNSDESEGSWDDNDCDPSFLLEPQNMHEQQKSSDEEQQPKKGEQEGDIQDGPISIQEQLESNEGIPHAPLYAECSNDCETQVQNRAKRGRKQTRQFQ